MAAVRWVTRKELAALLGCSVDSVKRSLRAGRLRACQLGGPRSSWRIAVDADGEPLPPKRRGGDDGAARGDGGRP